MNEVKKNRSDKNLEKYDVAENNVDLLEVISQLWRGKKIIFSCIAIMLLLTVGYLKASNERWSSHAILTLPTFGQLANYNAALTILYADNTQDKPSVSNVQAQLFSRFTASISAYSLTLNNQKQPQKLTVNLAGANSDSLNLTFTSISAKTAQFDLTNYINKINNEVVQDYLKDIKFSIGVKTRDLKNSLETYTQVAIDKKQHRIDVIKQALKVAQASSINKLQVNQAEYLSDDTLYLLGSEALTAMIDNEKTKPLELDDKYYDAQRALLSLTHLKVDLNNLSSFHYISKADLPINRDGPKKAVSLLIAILLGGLIGIVIILSRNLLTAYRSRQ